MKGVYLMGGYPDSRTFSRACAAARNAGFDFIEIGVPHNDPVADGPVIAHTHLDALARGIHPADALDAARQASSLGMRLYVMCYANAVYSFGPAEFSASMSGVLRGVIIPDLPRRHHDLFAQKGLALPVIPFVTLESRMDDIAALSSTEADFIYFIGLRGITGQAADLCNGELTGALASLRRAARAKIIIGFGIKTSEHAHAALSLADGFVVGTEAVRRQHNPDELERYLRSLA